jgi:putative Holliday junction resolvase
MKKGPPRVLAIDFGATRIGLAISDGQKMFATPLENITGAKSMADAIERIKALLATCAAQHGWEVDEIVVGLPLSMDGSDSARTTVTREFAQKLREQVPVTVALLDERLTSVQAERFLMQTNYTRKKRSQFVDRIAAAILLETYLSRKAGDHARGS